MRTGTIYNSTAITEPCLSTETPLPTYFLAPEGVYRQMTVSTYNKPHRVNKCLNPIITNPVRVSFLTIPLNERNEKHNLIQSTSSQYDQPLQNSNDFVERICFNIGRELYIYDFGGQESLDTRTYKSLIPTCHDFNRDTATLRSCSLIIGFSQGQLHLIDPCKRDTHANIKVFNDERLFDNTPVTSVKWVPGQSSLFVCSYSSGNLYVYNEEYNCHAGNPSYQLAKQGAGYNIYNHKAKTPKNPIQKWTIGSGAINRFEFSRTESPLLATAGEDGFLRIFNFKSMELVGFFKSYFGGLLCLSWSPDQKLVVTGGEDDMLTVYSVAEMRVICRGQGHKSWISEVSFDPFAPQPLSFRKEPSEIMELERPFPSSIDSISSFNNQSSSLQKSSKAISHQINGDNFNTPNHANSADLDANFGRSEIVVSASDTTHNPVFLPSRRDSCSISSIGWANNADDSMRNTLQNGVFHSNSKVSTTLYRIGSVGHDCLLCLWDLSVESLDGRDTPDNCLLNIPPTLQYVAAPSTSNSGTLNMKSSSHNVSTSPLATLVPSKNATTIIPIGIDNILVVPKNESLPRNIFIDNPTSSNQSNKRKNTPMKGKTHKRGLSLGGGWKLSWNRSHGIGSSHNSANQNGSPNASDDVSKIFGTAQCPRINDVPIIEPLLSKKISQERLTVLHFRKESLITACQEGIICTWIRPSAPQKSNNGLFDSIH